MRWLFTGLALVTAVGCGTMGRHTPVDPPGASRAHAEERESGRAEEHGRAESHGGADDHDDEPLPTDPAVIARAAHVRVLQNESIGCASEALGPVDVHKKMENTQKALDELKLRAAAMGAEAVIGVDFEHGEGGKAPTHLSGMALRCRDMLRGRTYDVLGELKVSGAMGKEEDAFKQLKAKGAAMNADLILNVKFDHGEGGAGDSTTVTGTAIRFRAP